MIPAIQKIAASAARAGRLFLGLVRDLVIWLSPPRRLLPFLLSLVFLVSLATWAIADRNSAYLLWFTRARDGAPAAELRDLPRRLGAEARAELLVSEFLLGPADPRLAPTLPPGVSLRSILLREGVLHVDLSEDAAFASRAGLDQAIAGLTRSVLTGLRMVREVRVTIDGQEPLWGGPPLPAESKKRGEMN